MASISPLVPPPRTVATDQSEIHDAAVDRPSPPSAAVASLLPGLIRRAESDIPLDDLRHVPPTAPLSNSAFGRGNRALAPGSLALPPSGDIASTCDGWVNPAEQPRGAAEEGLTKRIVPSLLATSTASLDDESRRAASAADGEEDVLPGDYFGRLQSNASREGSESGGIIAEFAKGNKSMAMVASKDLKNRWLVTFSLNIFVEQFLIHMFGPLSIPYIRYRYGWTMVVNLQLDRFAPHPRSVGNYLWAFWVVMMALYATFETPHITFSEVFVASCLFLARNTIIAAKYAYFSPGHLADVANRLLTPEEQAASLIVTGWHTPTATTIRSELQYALKRTRIDLRHMYLGFQADDHAERVAIARKLHASFEDVMKTENRCAAWQDSWLERIGQGEMPGHLLVVSLLTEAVKAHMNKPYIKLSMLAGLGHALIPSLMRLGSDPATVVGTSAAEVLIVAFAFVLSGFNVFANLAFVFIGIMDYDRRVYLMHQCSAMVTSSYKIWQTGSSQLMPLLHFERSVNIANWLDMRLLLKDFGLQYHLRIQAYASLWVFFMAMFVAYLFSQVILLTSEMTAIVLICYDLALVLGSLLVMVDSAKTLNQQHLEHKRILLRRLDGLQRQISRAVEVAPDGRQLDFSSKHLQHLEDAKAMLAVAIQVMDHEDHVAPIRILGFDANNNFSRGLLGIVGSSGIAGAKIIFGF